MNEVHYILVDQMIGHTQGSMLTNHKKSSNSGYTICWIRYLQRFHCPLSIVHLARRMQFGPTQLCRIDFNILAKRIMTKGIREDCGQYGRMPFS